MSRRKAKSWTFVDDNDSSNSSEKEEFEVLPTKDVVSQSEFEIIPTQKVRCLDENELNVRENHFLSGESSSDSDIEVIPTDVGAQLYSQVLRQSLTSNATSDIWEEDIDDSKNATGVESDNEDDDSDIEVVTNFVSETDWDNTLEIVFSNDADEIQVIEEGFQNPVAVSETADHTELEPEDISLDSEETTSLGSANTEPEWDDYYIRKLFDDNTEEDSLEDIQIEEKKSLKTSTLIILLCLCAATGVVVGRGCVSVLVINNEDNVPSTNDFVADHPSEIFLSIDGNIVNAANIWSSSSNRENVKSLIASYNELKRETNLLRASLDDFKERYQLQKKITWYWRKLVKKNISDTESPRPVIYDGLMDMSEGKGEDMVRIMKDIEEIPHIPRPSPPQRRAARRFDPVLSELNLHLQQERAKAQYWKDKYTFIKLTKMKKCAKLGKVLKSTSFSFSSCLMMISNVWPDFNITSNLPNLTKPVEKMANHVHNAWDNLKKRWKINLEQNEHVIQKNVDRFRKIFTISNIIKTVRPKNVPDSKKYCADDAYNMFQRRWKEDKKLMHPKPDVVKQSVKQDQQQQQQHEFNQSCGQCVVTNRKDSKITYTCGEDVYEEVTDKEYPFTHFPCFVADLYIEKVDGKIKTITKITPSDKNPMKRGNMEEGESQVRVKTEDIKSETQNVVHDNAEEWYKKKIDELNFKFDVYKWHTDGKIKSVLTDFDKKLSILAQKQKQTDKNQKILEQKEDKKTRKENLRKYDSGSAKNEEKWEKKNIKELKEVEKRMLYKQKKYDEWRFTEKLNLKTTIKTLKKKIREQKEKFRRKTEMAKKIFVSKLQKEYEHLKQKNNDLDNTKKNIVKKMANYKTKYQVISEEVKELKGKYNNLVELYDSLLDSTHENVKNQHQNIADYSNTETEDETSEWRFPMVYCPNQDNCQVKYDTLDLPTEIISRPTIFELANTYEVESKEFSPVPPKPRLPRSLLDSEQPKTLQQSAADFFAKLGDSISNGPARPTPSKRDGMTMESSKVSETDFLSRLHASVFHRPSSFPNPPERVGSVNKPLIPKTSSVDSLLKLHTSIPKEPNTPNLSKRDTTPHESLTTTTTYSLPPQTSPTMPPKPVPPRRLSYPQDPTTDKTLPPRPSPPKKSKTAIPSFTLENNTTDDDGGGMAIPLSWYWYWGKERREYNEYDHVNGVPLNWYLKLMKSREDYRHEAQTEEEDFAQMNWYLKLMHERGKRRTVEIRQHDLFDWMNEQRVTDED